MAYILQQLLTEIASKFPERTAVWARGRSLSYQDLEQQSNQLAHLLRKHGVKRGDRVGLYFPKSIESAVSMLGVLKAGAIYVPLDPQAPPRRILYMIGDCGIRALISTSEQLQALDPEGMRSVELTVLTRERACSGEHHRSVTWKSLADFPATHPPEGQGITTDLAYILYTSGSTGRPKGVMLSHQNALTFVQWCAETFHIQPGDRLSNHAPLHFDLSVFDIYCAIQAGATVYMIPDEVALFPASLANFIQTQGITVWYSVPSALVYLLVHARPGVQKLDCLRLILFAGEVFPMKYLRQLSELLPAAELYNLYGPTETNVCTYYKVDRSCLASLDRLPIGKACANTEVFAVNDRDELTKPGETGELYVRGPSTTYGYWGDAEKTKKALVPNRFQPHFEEKAYRTGDLVKLGEDENYHFLGRIDSMIKSRGYRIELGEIEAALLSHPGVREAAAVPIPDQEVGARIQAAVAPHNLASITAAELQQHCASRIPAYMVPEFIEFLAELPKTSNGKIDRVGLAARVASQNREHPNR